MLDRQTQETIFYDNEEKTCYREIFSSIKTRLSSTKDLRLIQELIFLPQER